MLFGGAAEAAALGVAVGAAEVALLRDGERQRADGRPRGRRVVDVGGRVDAEPRQQVAQRGLVAGAADAIDLLVDLRLDVVQPAAVGDEQVQPFAAVDEVGVRAQRRRQSEELSRRNPGPPR